MDWKGSRGISVGVEGAWGWVRTIERWRRQRRRGSWGRRRGWGGRLRSRVKGERARESGVDVSWFFWSFHKCYQQHYLTILARCLSLAQCNLIIKRFLYISPLPCWNLKFHTIKFPKACSKIRTNLGSHVNLKPNFQQTTKSIYSLVSTLWKSTTHNIKSKNKDFKFDKYSHKFPIRENNHSSIFSRVYFF